MRHRAAAPAVRLGGACGWGTEELRRGRGRVGRGEAQGGCACCAVRGSLWVRHRAAAPAVRSGEFVGEAQGGCACCAVRGSLWVRHGAAAPAMRLDRDENVGYGGFSNCTFRADMVKSVSECMRAGDAQVQLSIVFTGGIYNGTV